MPKYTVDVKAFINVEVEAADAASARAAADRFVDGLSPTEHYVQGWNIASAVNGKPKILEGGELDIDGTSDVERLCEECHSTTESLANSLCWCCEPEEPEPPLDTPSLDTSFHDHEMDV